MIKLSQESATDCAACGKPAVRREVYVYSPGLGGRYVTYDTHEESIVSEGHLAALERMDAFHDRLHRLLSECKAVPREQRALIVSGSDSEPGPESDPTPSIKCEITEIDFAAVQPCACEPRTLVEPLLTIRAFGLTRGVTLPPRPLSDCRIEALLSEAQSAIAEAAQALREQFREGSF